MSKPEHQHWEISARQPWLSLHLKEIWDYRDLILLIVKRDYVSFYQQTILGPLWFVVQPLISALVFQLVFSKMAGLSTEGIPGPLFYITGVTFWNYFSECLTKTASVLKDNVSLFGKVYFPRIIVPLSISLSALIRFSVQFVLCGLTLLYYKLRGFQLYPNPVLLGMPVFILVLAALSLGIGMLLSALTVKYRDLAFLLSFSLQMLMYATPVIIPYSAVPQRYKWIIDVNPMTPLLEGMRYGFTGHGAISWKSLVYSAVFSFAILLAGIIVFNRVQKNYIDIV